MDSAKDTATFEHDNNVQIIDHAEEEYRMMGHDEVNETYGDDSAHHEESGLKMEAGSGSKYEDDSLQFEKVSSSERVGKKLQLAEFRSP